MRRQDEIDKLLGRGQFSVPSPIPEEIDYSKLQHPGAPTGFQAPEPPPAMPPVSQLKDPMNRQLMEERMNPEPQLGTQTEKALSDKQLLEQYLSDKFMQGDIDAADERARKAQLYASLGGAMNTITKGLTGAEIEPDVYQKMFAQDLNAPKNALEKRREMREALLKKYGLGVQEKESEARLAALKADQAYKKEDLDLKRQELGIKEKTAANQIPESVKPAANKLSEGVASKVSIADQIESAVSKMEQVSEPEQLQIGRELLKVLNSTEGKDAIGAEESKRLGAKLQWALGNFTNDNPMQFGRDIEGFMRDAKNKAAIVKESAQKDLGTYKQITGKDFPLTVSVPQQDAIPQGATMRRKRPDGTWEYK